MAECVLCNVVLEIMDQIPIEFILSEPDNNCVEFELGDAVIGKNPEIYDGDYEVIPKINMNQTLDTKDKLLEDDVYVHEISVSYVSNLYGGNTVTIGVI